MDIISSEEQNNTPTGLFRREICSEIEGNTDYCLEMWKVYNNKKIYLSNSHRVLNLTWRMTSLKSKQIMQKRNREHYLSQFSDLSMGLDPLGFFNDVSNCEQFGGIIAGGIIEAGLIDDSFMDEGNDDNGSNGCSRCSDCGNLVCICADFEWMKFGR
ncbi:hypothetical protein PP7435_CHR1-1785 [Komagataella phaffii CBS 7435]|uniref:Nitrogen regulatory protein areA GATA-like domain-containing protein n=2 Tax=Komagataella phaffii TaxID=460519 RepID=C4QVG2_KOMPG|nr:uncharacterized protein PAS_chr1-3_0303 [Komagataella phaffii GS115]AOA61029.1 GQ67_02427T0 [Komagataella phaffii]CAH2445891.1 hypothetical protein BQ9382_C1-0930 [Komagataella phaffii CBS 7435]AOA65936.1 GQ68_02820T0 [Komagataella phaffii GS115]CAY67235.1 hypothetical protein PAS_chr1-3_0303 [Komagataella phaffii GS115]SCV11770.1 hypothetical protein PP7435_CHR1-1785 [Komagataella phaffii CBS 7435]